VGAWGASKDRRLKFIEKSFELTAETKYGGTLNYECEEEENSRWWEQLQQNY